MWLDSISADEMYTPLFMGVYSVYMCFMKRHEYKVNPYTQCRIEREKEEYEASCLLKALPGLLIYDVIFRLGYIFDASYLSNLILSENSGRVCQPRCMTLHAHQHTVHTHLHTNDVWRYLQAHGTPY